MLESSGGEKKINDPGKPHQLTAPGKGSRKRCKEEKGLSNFPKLCTADLLESPVLYRQWLGPLALRHFLSCGYTTLPPSPSSWGKTGPKFPLSSLGFSFWCFPRLEKNKRLPCQVLLSRAGLVKVSLGVGSLSPYRPLVFTHLSGFTKRNRTACPQESRLWAVRSRDWDGGWSYVIWTHCFD